MRLRAAISATTKGLWHNKSHSNKHREADQDPKSAATSRRHHKDSDGATTAATAKSSSCGTTGTYDPATEVIAVGPSNSTTTSSLSLLKLARAVSRLGGGGGVSKDDERSTGRGGAGGRSVSSNSLSTGCRTGPLQRGEPLQRQITGPFQLHDSSNDNNEQHSYIDDDTHDGDDNNDEMGLKRIRGHPFEMTEEDKRVILSCLAHHQKRRQGSLHRSMSSSSLSHNTPQYRVEICAKGPEDDDTLDGIMTEKLKEEARAAKASKEASSTKSPVVAAAAAAGLMLFRARSGGSKSSAGGILASLRRSSGSVVSSLSGTYHKVPSSVGRAPSISSRGRGSRAGEGDADTLDEFLAREEHKEEDKRRRTLRRVGSGILESLDRLRRTHSSLLDRNDLWLKRSLEAIEMAKLAHNAPRPQQPRQRTRSSSHSSSRDRRRSSSHPRDIVVKRHNSSNTQDSPISSMLHNFTDGGNDEPITPPLIEMLQDRVEEFLPRCTGTAEPVPADLVPPFLDTGVIEVEDDDDRVPVSPIPEEDDATVALIEVFVHYLTCGHVLRDHELKKSPRLTCFGGRSATTSAAACADSPMMIPNLDDDEESHGRHGKVRLQRRREPQYRRERGGSFCYSTDCGADDEDDYDDDEEDDLDYDDEDRTYRSDYDDGTLEGSIRHSRRMKEMRSAINSEFARSSTETTYEEKKDHK